MRRTISRRFGFVPDQTLSVHKNARQVLGNTPVTTYFPSVKKLAFHDLTKEHKLPPSANQLLGLGLKFIPTPWTNITPTEREQATARFERDLGLKVYFAGEDTSESYDPKALRGKSKWRAPLPPLEIDNRLQHFVQWIDQAFEQREDITPNMTRLQSSLLKQIKRDANIIILSADKGLGPVGVDTKQYIEWGLQHLLDTSTYTMLNEDQANEEAIKLYNRIFLWITTHRRSLDDDTVRFIRERVEAARLEPFGYFYLLAKLHKTPVSTRPVCSDCASLPHSVGKWVDKQLQPIVKQQRTYFQDSFELKHLLDELTILPPSACLFTYDAVSMYTNINTEDCLQRLTDFINNSATTERYPHLRPAALVEALHIVMHNNRMIFGNLFFHQHKGIAMGMAPAPSIANLFVAIYEETHLATIPNTSLHFLRRFIDDGLGIWLRDPNQEKDEENWTHFQDLINAMGLQWEFSKRSADVTFMDLNIHLRNGRITTSLYAKPMALHLYIPPSSCHAPGIATGLIYGQFYRIFQLCSHKHDIEREIHAFFTRLLDRGYSPSDLTPLFLNAEIKAREHVTTKKHQRLQQRNSQANPHTSLPTDDQNIFLHLQYHPNNPPASSIQQSWRTNMFCPPGKQTLTHLKNRDGVRVGINKLIVAYSRAPNIGNLLSCRKLKHKIEDFTDLIPCNQEHDDTQH